MKYTSIKDLPTRYQIMTERNQWIENEIIKIAFEINEDGTLKYPMGIPRPEIIQKRLDNLSMEKDILSDKLKSLKQKIIKINNKKIN
jgi:hypothetical protein